MLRIQWVVTLARALRYFIKDTRFDGILAVGFCVWFFGIIIIFFLGVAVEVCQLVFDRTIVLLYLWGLQVLLVYGRT